ncbi:uncharacterized protein LAESUDRAFT_692928, partial [Laetiporus sulphureus 93-53]
CHNRPLKRPHSRRHAFLTAPCIVRLLLFPLLSFSFSLVELSSLEPPVLVSFFCSLEASTSTVFCRKDSPRYTASFLCLFVRQRSSSSVICATWAT